MKRSKPKPTLVTQIDDAMDAGKDAYETMRELELALAQNGILRPQFHKTMKHYFRLWNVLKKDLQYTHLVAERRETIQRLGGMK